MDCSKDGVITFHMGIRDERIAGRLVQRQWRADLGAYGGRRSRQGFFYDAFIPDPIADLNPVLPGDVAQVAITHAQFETIHPFADGNGRVGRCLIHVVLRRRGLADRYVPPISVVLATNSRAYIGGLNDYRSGTLAEWCGLFAAATRTAAHQAQELTGQLADLEAQWWERAQSLGGQRGIHPAQCVRVGYRHAG